MKTLIKSLKNCGKTAKGLEYRSIKNKELQAIWKQHMKTRICYFTSLTMKTPKSKIEEGQEARESLPNSSHNSRDLNNKTQNIRISINIKNLFCHLSQNLLIAKTVMTEIVLCQEDKRQDLMMEKNLKSLLARSLDMHARIKTYQIFLT